MGSPEMQRLLVRVAILSLSSWVRGQPIEEATHTYRCDAFDLDVVGCKAAHIGVLPCDYRDNQCHAALHKNTQGTAPEGVTPGSTPPPPLQMIPSATHKYRCSHFWGDAVGCAKAHIGVLTCEHRGGQCRETSRATVPGPAAASVVLPLVRCATYDKHGVLSCELDRAAEPPAPALSIVGRTIDVAHFPFRCATYDKDPAACAAAHYGASPCELIDGHCRMVGFLKGKYG